MLLSLLHPSGWRCEVCDLQENLWVNLTDGKVLCGRRYFDGSGGNNHALLHFQETGYPLAVKLGTITPDGAGKKTAQIFFSCGKNNKTGLCVNFTIKCNM